MKNRILEFHINPGSQFKECDHMNGRIDPERIYCIPCHLDCCPPDQVQTLNILSVLRRLYNHRLIKWFPILNYISRTLTQMDIRHGLTTIRIGVNKRKFFMNVKFSSNLKLLRMKNFTVILK